MESLPPADATNRRTQPDGMLMCMQDTSVRIDRKTHDELKQLAEELGLTVGKTVALGVRRLRQERMGRQLARPLDPEEIAWLDADLG